LEALFTGKYFWEIKIQNKLLKVIIGIWVVDMLLLHFGDLDFINVDGVIRLERL
jgi:hypothetical protein